MLALYSINSVFRVEFVGKGEGVVYGWVVGMWIGRGSEFGIYGVVCRV